MAGNRVDERRTGIMNAAIELAEIAFPRFDLTLRNAGENYANSRRRPG